MPVLAMPKHAKAWRRLFVGKGSAVWEEELCAQKRPHVPSSPGSRHATVLERENREEESPRHTHELFFLFSVQKYKLCRIHNAKHVVKKAHVQ